MEWNMKTTKAVLPAFALSVALAFSLSACSPQGATPPPAQASGQTTAPQGAYEMRGDTGVDVLYFETANPCDCMAEVGVAIKNSVATHFAEELQNGELRFFVIVSDDWANKATFELFNNQPFDLFIVEFEDGSGVATPVNEFWGMMGDNEAIDSFVQERVQESLSKLG
jgi:hypothetical protein